MIDARAGLTPADRAFADLVRKAGKPAIVCRQQERGPGAGMRAPTRPTPSASASRCRFRPSTARAWPISTTRYARRCPSRPRQRAHEEPRAARRGRAADPRRGRRAAERRQVDADQPAGRRGAAADRPGSRHHPRRHRGRSLVAGHGPSSSTTPPACAGARGSRTSSRSCRSPTRSRRSASPRSSSC